MVNKVQDVFYVGINEPSELRKEILESSKVVIEDLKKYEKVRLLRESKNKEVARLKKIIKEIDNSFNKLKLLLPKTTLKPVTEDDEILNHKKEMEDIDSIEEVREKSEKNELKLEEKYKRADVQAEIRALKAIAKKKTSKKKTATKKTSKKKVVKKKAVKKKVAELDKLEKELKEITSKLNEL